MWQHGLTCKTDQSLQDTRLHAYQQLLQSPAALAACSATHVRKHKLVPKALFSHSSACTIFPTGKSSFGQKACVLVNATTNVGQPTFRRSTGLTDAIMVFDRPPSGGRLASLMRFWLDSLPSHYQLASSDAVVAPQTTLMRPTASVRRCWF